MHVAVPGRNTIFNHHNVEVLYLLRMGHMSHMAQISDASVKHV